jgi:AraC-like DNA-binding protein
MIKTDSRESLHTALAEIKQHLGDVDFTVDWLSRKLGMSRMQLHRRLRELGQPAAGELLRRRRLTIAEVAYRSGFRSPAYFAHSFAHVMAARPGTLHRGHRAESKGQKLYALRSRLYVSALCSKKDFHVTYAMVLIVTGLKAGFMIRLVSLHGWL